MTVRRALADHLHWYGELGVAGLSRERLWRERTDTGAQDEPGGDRGLAPANHGASATGHGDTLAAGRLSDKVAALKAVRDDLGDCTRCILHTLGRRQVVFGVGNPDADLMFVGEAPGADEDAQGEPFVGRAGQLLTKIIEAIGLSRGDVYIANVIKCRPPGNRNPEPVEVATCQPFLFRQIDVVQPKVIVALGTFAAHTLLETDAPISRLRGRVYDYRGGSKLIPTFHPAFLLRSPDKKREVWEDMKQVRAVLTAGD